ncbi:RidA family protein [Leucobacter sp. GX24907]
MNDVAYRSHGDGKPRPYSATASFGGTVWACGQVPVAADGSIAETMTAQVEQVFANLDTVLYDAGSSRDRILKITVYLSDLGEFDEYNTAYLRMFDGLTLPPRTTVQVAGFRGQKRIELDAVAAAR